MADALEDAGCHDPEIVAHCRDCGEHVRRCWVVDAVTGRKQGWRMPNPSPPRSRLAALGTAGALRRDCEPHRGELLAGLGELILICGMVSLLTCAPALIGLVVSLVVIAVAQRDLARMRRGEMNPAGR